MLSHDSSNPFNDKLTRTVTVMKALEKIVDEALAAEAEAEQDMDEARTKTLATAQLSPLAEELLRARITLLPVERTDGEDVLRIDVKGWRA